MSRPAYARKRAGMQVTLRALGEFAAAPLLIVAAFALLAAVSVLGDQERVPALDAARSAVSQVIGKDAASATLQAIAAGLVTVTSITFSVLLLAVQQASSSLSPVVFDQWVRRRSNQLFLGFFVGLSFYAYVVLALVPDKTAPTLGAAIATALTSIAMVLLLALVYLTVDQMRPVNVIRFIHERTLAARSRELQLVARTRRVEESDDPVSATYRATTAGYVNAIDLTKLERALTEIPDAEIYLRVTLGQHVGFGDAIATVRDDDEQHAQALADEVRDAIVIGTRRDTNQDATAGIDGLANIGWSNGSTARQNPEIARTVLDALKDIGSRWLTSEPPEPNGPPLRCVYDDNDLHHLFDTLHSILVAAHESHQHQTAARVVDVYTALHDRAPSGARAALEDYLDRARPMLDELPDSPPLERTRATLGERDGHTLVGPNGRLG